MKKSTALLGKSTSSLSDSIIFGGVGGVSPFLLLFLSAFSFVCSYFRGEGVGQDHFFLSFFHDFWGKSISFSLSVSILGKFRYGVISPVSMFRVC